MTLSIRNALQGPREVAPLVFAVRHGSLACVQVLLHCSHDAPGSGTAASSTDGMRALHEDALFAAIEAESPEMLRELIFHGRRRETVAEWYRSNPTEQQRSSDVKVRPPPHCPVSPLT